jgi:hypothetical protein
MENVPKGGKNPGTLYLQDRVLQIGMRLEFPGDDGKIGFYCAKFVIERVNKTEENKRDRTVFHW